MTYQNFIKIQKQHEWNMVFIIAATIYMVGCVIYWFFVSGELQSWAKPKKDDIPMRSVPIEGIKPSNESFTWFSTFFRQKFTRTIKIKNNGKTTCFTNHSNSNKVTYVRRTHLLHQQIFVRECTPAVNVQIYKHSGLFISYFIHKFAFVAIEDSRVFWKFVVKIAFNSVYITWEFS